MKNKSSKKFFVTVISSSKSNFVNLQKYGLDLFKPTSKVTEKNEFVIGGLMTLEKVEQLVENGYQVLVKEESSKRARAHVQIVDFKDWIKEM